MKLNELTIREAHEGLSKKQFSATELLQACLDRIIAVDDSQVKAFITVTETLARRQAAAVDKKIASGEDFGWLAGIPLAVKDVITVAGERATAASKILENYIAPYDATVISRLKAAGAVIIGKANCDEFAHGASGEYSAFFPTHNPWDLKRVAGGSSAGPAAAVAASECLAALGTDTGGSIRCPASFCGLVGLKSTYGRVSRSGLMSMTSSTDTIGPLTKNIEDAALVLKEIAGVDEKDSTSVSQPVEDYPREIQKKIAGMKIGVVKECFGKGLDLAVESLVRKTIDDLEGLGAEIKEVSLPHNKYAIPVYYILTPSEISANLARFDGLRFGRQSKAAENLFEVYAKSRGEGFGPEVKRRIMLGTYALSAGYYDAYYLQAQRVRTVIKQEIDKVFKDIDVLLTPTSPHTAFPIGEQVDDPLKMYLEDIYLSLASIIGLPAVSVPCGFASGLPVGVQFIGKQFGEADILRLGYSYQKVTDWHKSRPEL